MSSVVGDTGDADVAKATALTEPAVSANQMGQLWSHVADQLTDSAWCYSSDYERKLCQTQSHVSFTFSFLLKVSTFKELLPPNCAELKYLSTFINCKSTTDHPPTGLDTL